MHNDSGDAQEPQDAQPWLRWFKQRPLIVAGIAVGVILVVAISVGAYFLITNKQSRDNQAASPSEDKAAMVGRQLSGGKCSGTGSAQLGVLPMKEADFGFILPYGLMIGGHVTPVDHQYFSPAVFQSAKDTYPVYAMADAKIVSVETHPTRTRLVFAVSCTFFYYYDLLTSVAQGIDEKSLPVDVKAGQLVGRIGGQTLDFAVWDTTKPLKGFVVPEHYKAETWKLYTADPLDYYTPDVKKVVLSKYIRTAEPLSGKIDDDIDGKLAGTWFQTGTNGYGGTSGEGGGSYWIGHLSFAPEYLDPTTQVISVGYLAPDDGSGSNQFVVPKDAPKPSAVSPETGLVKYPLAANWGYKTASGSLWDRMSFVSGGLSVDHSIDSTAGCALVQMTSTRALKFEAFPGQTCSAVQGFRNPKTYER